MSESANDVALQLLRAAFDDTDRDNSGGVCGCELKALFKKAGLETTDDEVNAIMQKFDKNNDSVLSFQEICDGIQEHPYLQSVLSLRGQFLKVDKDRTGFITMDEHLEALKEMGNPWGFTEDHMRSIFTNMDVNGDGKVSFEELIKAYCVKPER